MGIGFNYTIGEDMGADHHQKVKEQSKRVKKEKKEKVKYTTKKNSRPSIDI